jgi:chemotaxis protein methyltransferase CheR
VRPLVTSPAVVSLLASLIEDASGLSYGAGDSELLVDRLSTRARERGLDSLLDYYYFLRYDPEGPAELTALLEALVVQETYFFRELPPLVALVDLILAPRVAAGQRPRVWCAAAATGEEPLTLAMLLARRDLLASVEILATDLSQRSLAHARRGVFGRRSLRALEPGFASWLHVDGDEARVDPRLVAAIRWAQVNLAAPFDDEQLGGSFDAIVCRNVLIYFSNATTQRVVEQLTARLRPDGVLLVGVAESLLRVGTLLRCEERGGAFFYERALP